jgi:hypothetical protein
MKVNNKFNIDTDSLMDERWIPVHGFEGRFKISNFGRILSIGGKYGGIVLMNPNIDSLGYYVSTLRSFDWETMEVKQRAVRIHTLVAEHFLIKPQIKKPEVNHIDGNKLNNKVSNLEWTTHKENIRHAIRIGLMDNKGEKHPFHKLTKEQVVFCRNNYKRYSKEWGSQSLADMFGISRRNMSDIINGVTWSWLDEGLKKDKQLTLPL